MNPLYYAMRKTFLDEFAKVNRVRFNEVPLKEGDDEFLNQGLEYVAEPGVVMSTTVRALATGEWGHLVEGVNTGLAQIREWSDALLENSNSKFDVAKFALNNRTYTTHDLTEMLRYLGVVTHPPITSRVRLCIQLADVTAITLKGWKET